jgi:hypothetical protein
MERAIRRIPDSLIHTSFVGSMPNGVISALGISKSRSPFRASQIPKIKTLFADLLIFKGINFFTINSSYGNLIQFLLLKVAPAVKHEADS